MRSTDWLRACVAGCAARGGRRRSEAVNVCTADIYIYIAVLYNVCKQTYLAVNVCTADISSRDECLYSRHI